MKKQIFKSFAEDRYAYLKEAYDPDRDPHGRGPDAFKVSTSDSSLGERSKAAKAAAEQYAEGIVDIKVGDDFLTSIFRDINLFELLGIDMEDINIDRPERSIELEDYYISEAHSQTLGRTLTEEELELIEKCNSQQYFNVMQDRIHFELLGF